MSNPQRGKEREIADHHHSTTTTVKPIRSRSLTTPTPRRVPSSISNCSKKIEFSDPPSASTILTTTTNGLVIPDVDGISRREPLMSNGDCKTQVLSTNITYHLLHQDNGMDLVALIRYCM
ncbi:hypothetical protein ACFX12_019528 [Malus domestica]